MVYSVALWAGGVAAQAAGQVPLWAYLALSLLGTGFFGKWFNDRRDKKWEQRLQDATAQAQEQTARLTGADTDAKLDDIRRRLVSEAQDAMARLEDRLHDTEARLSETMVRAVQAEAQTAQVDAELRAIILEKEQRVSLLLRRIDALNDRLLAYEKGEEFGKRHGDEPGPDVPRA